MIIPDPFRDPAASSLSQDDVPPRPADTNEYTHDLDREYVLDEPVYTWVQRPWRGYEVETRNRETIIAQAGLALVQNTTFLELETLTNAQVVAQVKDLTRQMNKLIRLVVGALNSTE